MFHKYLIFTEQFFSRCWVNLIISEKQLSLNSENKIIWKNAPIAKIKKGENYLNPDLEIITDDALPENTKITSNGKDAVV